MSERMMIRNKISCFFVEIEDNIVDDGDDGDDGGCLLVVTKKMCFDFFFLAGAISIKMFVTIGNGQGGDFRVAE